MSHKRLHAALIFPQPPLQIHKAGDVDSTEKNCREKVVNQQVYLVKSFFSDFCAHFIYHLHEKLLGETYYFLYINRKQKLI